MIKKPSIVVSNPIRLHSHHQVYALQQCGYLQKFICSTWHKPQKFPYTHFHYLPKRLQQKIETFFAKRCHEKIEARFVEQHPIAEISRVLLNQIMKNRFNKSLVDWQQRSHDKFAARRICQIRPDIVIGYEISCAKTFAMAKKHGMITILDLANVHYEHCTPLEQQFDGGDFNPKLTLKINRRKNQEYLHSDYIFCISRLAYDSLVNHGIPEHKIRLINLGADLSIFHPKKYVKRDKLSLLFVGSIIRRKGIDLLLKAVENLQQYNIELKIVGAHDHNNLLCKYDKQLYQHIPFLSHKELVREYQKADILVLPSYLDSWGMVVNEAMACGTPVIISDGVGSKDIVTPQNGFVIPNGDAKALEEVIFHCYRNRDLLPQMGKNAIASVENFTWENYARRLQSVIDDIYDRNDS